MPTDSTPQMSIDHWKGSRRQHALYDTDGALIGVFVYKKGAEHVRRLITDLRTQTNANGQPAISAR